MRCIPTIAAVLAGWAGTVLQVAAATATASAASPSPPLPTGAAVAATGASRDGTPAASPTSSTTTSYPTTVTSTWSTTITSFSSATPFSTPPSMWMVTTSTVTVIEPWPVSPDPAQFPMTMVQTSIVHAWTVLAGVSITASALMSTTTLYKTWVVWETQAADLPVGNVPRCEAGGCTPAAWKPNGHCLGLGMETRCRAQCIIRDWQWWCLKDDKQGKTADSPPMGRLCWGSATNYTQLVEPCDGTDYLPDCPACAASPPES